MCNEKCNEKVKCVTKGIYYKENRRKKGRVIFPSLNDLLRTDHSFRGQTQPLHHRGVSNLQELAINMIKSFPIDPMHLLDLGVMKKLLVAWAFGKYRRGSKLCEEKIC